MSFRRPPVPKIGKKVPRPKKSLRNLTRKSTKPPKISRRPLATRLQRSKKKKTVNLGVCYSGSKCTGKVLLRKVTKARCRMIGGKSWKGHRGCESF